MIGLPLDSNNGFGHMFNDWGMGWSGGWMILLWILLLGVIVWGIVALTRAGRPTERDARPTAGEVLDQRLARGEISEPEYRHLREALRDGSRADR